jgi:AcrR family transcriptional regulator
VADATTGGTRRPTQLPRGRHGLSREEVVRSQRDRILLALAEATAERGYAATPVAEVLRRAGVSRETFYELFSSKDEAFAAAYDRAVELLLQRITQGHAAAGEAPQDDGARMARVEALLTGYLDALADEPAFARVFLIEAHAAGPEPTRRRYETQRGIAVLIADLLDAHSDAQRFACESLVASISALVTARIATGEDVRGLRAPLLELLRRSGDLFGDLPAG